MGKIFAWRIRLTGRVQGVGFRPFVRNLAHEHGIHGQVRNDNNGLTIIVDATEPAAQRFQQSLRDLAPERSIITHLHVDQLPAIGFTSFDVIESSADDIRHIFLAPDYALCTACRSELRHPQNRRYQYAFTTCLDCGPRYSIQSAIPYDRARTSMAHMAMCAPCSAEYHHIDGRRSHSQTNSCPQCRIPIHLYRRGIEITGAEEQLFDHVLEALKKDAIVAIKGLSGYLLCCNAKSEKALLHLRNRKHRVAKPFAVLYPSIVQIQSNYIVSDREKEILESAIAPIVLLNPKVRDLPHLVAPGLSRVGVALPSTPMLQMIIDRCDFPIVATSGNITNDPLQYLDEPAIHQLGRIADLVMTYDREIVMPQDDSVVQYTRRHQQKIIIRRARGMAPEYIIRRPVADQCIYAFGSDMKNTLTIQSRNNIYITQYLGNAENYDVQERIEQTKKHFVQILKDKPSVVLADAHPGYQSSNLAKKYARSLSAKIHFVQHHKAHFAAIIEEHDLWSSEDHILGVVWDGTGYGEDRQVWGGEFMRWDGTAMQRTGHLNYTPIIAGDKMAKEPRLSALSFSSEIAGMVDLLKKKFTKTEWQTYHHLLSTATIQTSSIGRLFDGVAAMLDLCDINTYEGQAAMLLENLAEQYPYDGSERPYEVGDSSTISYNEIIIGIFDDIEGGATKASIAYRFHLTLVQIIDNMARLHSISTICFSGGVFQNALLVDLIIDKLDSSYKLYFHEKLSPNDEHISFGQWAYYNRLIKGKNG